MSVIMLVATKLYYGSYDPNCQDALLVWRRFEKRQRSAELQDLQARLDGWV